MRTKTLYELMSNYRNGLKAKEAELREREKDIEDLKGSSRYDKINQQISEERAEAYKAARERYAPEVNAILAKMLDAAKTTVPMQAPSEEALRTLQLLEMRYNQSRIMDAHSNKDNTKPLTRAELQAAMPLMGDCPTAIQALRNIATKCGYVLSGGHVKGISSDQAVEAIATMSRSLNTYFSIPKINNREQYGAMFSGSIPDTTGGRATSFWRLDVDHDNEDELIESLSFIPHDNLADFKNIINQE